MVRNAAPNMIESFTTSRPTPERQGKPWFESPSPGTQASGVVMRKERVVSAMNSRKLPMADSSGRTGYKWWE